MQIDERQYQKGKVRNLTTSFGLGYWILVLFFVFEYGRLQDYIEPLKILKIPFILTLILTLLMLKEISKPVLRDKQVLLHFVFILIMAITITFAVNTFYVYVTTKGMFLVFLTGVLPTIVFLNTYKKIRVFFRVWIWLFLFLSVMTIINRGVGPGGFLGDENDMALALNMAIPFAYFMSQSTANSKFIKTVYLVITVIMVLAVVATSSRGGFLGLVAVILAILYFTKNRIRNIIILIVLSVTSLVFVPDSYKQEIYSITDKTDTTRSHRLYFWTLGWEMFVDNPILGVGAGNYPWTNRLYELKNPDYNEATTRWVGGRPAHSLYFTLLPELGLAGTMLFAAIGLTMYRRLKEVSDDAMGKLTEDELEIRLLARALLASIFGFLVTAAFISVLYYPHYWYLNGFSLAMYLTYRKGLLAE